MSMEVDISRLDERSKALLSSVEKLEGLVDKVHNRLPNWALWVFGGGGMAIGSLITLLAICMDRIK